MARNDSSAAINDEERLRPDVFAQYLRADDVREWWRFVKGALHHGLQRAAIVQLDCVGGASSMDDASRTRVRATHCRDQRVRDEVTERLFADEVQFIDVDLRQDISQRLRRFDIEKLLRR